MTHATKAIYRWLLSDYIKVRLVCLLLMFVRFLYVNLFVYVCICSNIAADQMLYSEKDLENSMSRIEVVNFHQEVEVNGIKFWAYTAGHVLGAAMFMLEIAGVKVRT